MTDFSNLNVQRKKAGFGPGCLQVLSDSARKHNLKLETSWDDVIRKMGPYHGLSSNQKWRAKHFAYRMGAKSLEERGIGSDMGAYQREMLDRFADCLFARIRPVSAPMLGKNGVPSTRETGIHAKALKGADGSTFLVLRLSKAEDARFKTKERVQVEKDAAAFGLEFFVNKKGTLTIKMPCEEEMRRNAKPDSELPRPPPREVNKAVESKKPLAEQPHGAQPEEEKKSKNTATIGLDIRTQRI